MKKFWDTHYSENHYDPVSRRRSSSAAASLAVGVSQADTSVEPLKAKAGPTVRQSNSSLIGGVGSGARVNKNRESRGGEGGAADEAAIGALQSQVDRLQEAFALERIQSEGMQKERDFYFEKLREIEFAMQQVVDPEILESELYKLLNTILYKTEEGFDLPATAST